MSWSRSQARPLYTIGSRHQRVGCAHCFKTLDSDHQDPSNSGFVHCHHCNSSFHASHFSGNCPRCGSDQIVPATVVRPPPLRYPKLRRPIEFVPPEQAESPVRTTIRRSFDLSAYWAVIRHAIRLVDLGLLALVFVAMAAGLGAFTNRLVDVYQQSPASSNLPEQMLNVVLREDAPRPIVFTFAAFAAAVVAYALFPVTLRNNLGYRDVMRWIWRVAGGALLILGVNVVYFSLNFVKFSSYTVILANLLTQSASREILLAQLGASIATSVLAVPYLVITRNPPSPPQYPPPLNLIRVLGGFARYIIVFYAVISLSVSISMIQLGGNFGLIVWFFPQVLGNPTDWEARIAVAALSALAIGFLTYQIPLYRVNLPVKNPVNLALRILVSIGCLGLLALIYNRIDAELLIEAAALGGSLGLVFCPTQRAFT